MSDLIQASSRDTTGPLLELEDVKTYFKTPRGLAKWHPDSVANLLG